MTQARESHRMLREVSYFIDKAAALDAQRRGMSLEQLRLLKMVSSMEDAVRPAELALMALREPHTMSGMLNRLEEAGLITRKKGAWKDHKNWVAVELTAKGRKALDAAPSFEDDEASPFESLRDGDLATLFGLLRKVRNSAIERVRELSPVRGATE